MGTKDEAEVVYRNLLVEGLLSLQAGENPRLIREKLMAFLPPKARVEDAEAAAGAQAAEAGA
jgi:chemotaxis protein MotA